MSPESSSPLVSIGLPVFNGAKTLSKVLDDLLEQDYPHLELIISDNASTDETPEICQTYIAKDDRIVFFRSEENKGAVWNFNQVLGLSQGKYFMWAAHDDFRAKSFVRKCVARLESDEKAVLCQAYTEAYLDGLEKPLYRATMDTLSGIASPLKRFSEVIRHLPATAIYGLLRTETAKKVRPWGNYLATDVVFTHELTLYGEFIQVPEVLFFYVGRTQRRTPAEDYAVLNSGKRLPWWYFPFLVLFWQQIISINHTPLSWWQKIGLLFILLTHEMRMVTAKIFLRISRLLGMRRCPKWAARILDEPMFHNPNIHRILKESEIPQEHQRPSQQNFSSVDDGN